MSDDVKTFRTYRSPQRTEQAAATRRAVLEAARHLFVTNGYAATTVTRIAKEAGVNVDTLYAAVGRKPAILREVVETAISGRDRAVPAAERDYVRAVRAAPTAGEKIEIYAAAFGLMAPRIAPIFAALRDAASADPQCAELHSEITRRRADNMRLFAADLRATGSLRPDLTDGQVGDIVWSMNATEFYGLLVDQRGWTPAQFTEFLADAWRRLLLVEPAAGCPSVHD